MVQYVKIWRLWPVVIAAAFTHHHSRRRRGNRTDLAAVCVEVDTVKSESVRTNIVLDSKLIAAGLKATGLTTRRELVDFALRDLLRHKQQNKYSN